MGGVYVTWDRPAWADAAIAFALAAIGQVVALVGLASTGLGSAHPVAALVAPSIVGLLAGVVVPRGLAVGAAVAGVVVAFLVAPLLGAPDALAEAVPIALAAGAAGFGFAVAFGARQSQIMASMPRPPTPADRERLEAELTAQLRTIDPNAPGAFEQATVLLRSVNEQLSMYGPFSPWPAGGDKQPAAPTGLLRIQAELVEAARLSALAAGARRVTITSSGMGLDVEAVFGDPIVGEPVPSRDADPPGIAPID